MNDLYDNPAPTYRIALEHMRWGRFSVRAETAAESDFSEVLFVQTAVNLADPTETALVEQLAPVRETVAPELLSFESLIQRDLDDERVATRLIPYLLQDGANLVKMFPSILVLLLPMKDKRVEPLYHKRFERDEPRGAYKRVSFSYGDGDRDWAFEFSRLKTPAGSFVPFGAELRVNPQSCSFAIIDGQHRAMAVLALWRNRTTWPDAARPFKDFYANHPKETLEGVDLSGLSLPVTICFFPNLHRGNEQLTGDKSVIRAARKLFLDVNREARPPSRARQVLLDDKRVTSDFVRAIMTRIKDKKSSDPGLRLANLYYDQMQDNEGAAAMPRLAVTSVLHIQGMVRMLLLGKRPHSGKHAITRSDFQVFDPGAQDNNATLRDILDLEAVFGSDSNGWKDETVPQHHRPKITQLFMNGWGELIGYFLDAFPPFDAMAHASEVTRQHLEQSSHDEDPIVRRMLFEGRGLRAVHESVREQMSLSKEDLDGVPPYPSSTVDAFKKQGERLAMHEHRTLERAAERFWGDGQSWPAWFQDSDRDALTRSYNQELCAQVFKTKAFQVAVVMTIGHLERKLGVSDRILFWRTKAWRPILDKIFAFFKPGGFPGANLATERKAVWVKEELENGRIAGLLHRGYYRYVRDTLRGDLKDGKWQYLKCCLVEVVCCPLKPLREIEQKWIAAGPPEETQPRSELVRRIGEHLREAASDYRDLLLTYDFQHALDQYRKDNHRPADPETEAEFWTAARERMADRLGFSFGLSKSELAEVRNRELQSDNIGSENVEEPPDAAVDEEPPV